jgi:hypothetical protein
MHFNSWDAERIAAWKRQIANGQSTKEGLRGEITSYFALNGHDDPDAVLRQWNHISVFQEPCGSWTAFLHHNPPIESVWARYSL